MRDTSKEYIEQCKKATEIQEAWEAMSGDLYFDYRLASNGTAYENRLASNGTAIYEDSLACDGVYLMYIGKYIDDELCTWLPRQDQLQGMVSDNWYRTINKFYDYVTNDGYAEPGDPDHEEKDLDLALIQRVNSMEQLWLAFVMKEKYNKTWDGTDWVKVEEQS